MISPAYLYINTTGEEIVYTVPERLQDDAGYETVTISAGAPQLDGSFADPGWYFVLTGSGTLEVASMLDLDGNFYIEVSETEFELQVNATTDLVIGQMAASGMLRINEQGVVGSLQLAQSGGLGGDLFTMSGQFQLEINRT